MTARELIESAIKLAGLEAKLGRACGVSQGAIWKAKRAGRVSADLAVAIERATSERVPRWRLRPDLWDPPSLVATRATHPAGPPCQPMTGSELARPAQA